MQPITEADKEILDSWFVKKPENSVDEFINELNTKYRHDYGTACYALAAAAFQAAHKMNNQTQGHISHFQASAVMWVFIKKFMSYKGPLELVRYEDMLFPQYKEHFDKTIDPDTFEYLQKEAARLLADGELTASGVKEHWQSIVDGKIPFGYKIKRRN